MNRVMALTTAGIVAVLGVVVASAAVAAPTVAPAASHGPKIVASPDRVKVRQSTTLTGSGFKRHKKLTIWECSAKFWVVPRQICNHRNAIQVRTNSRGRFVVPMKMLLCPALKSPVVATAGSARRCFVGVPTPRGVDTVELVGAAQVTVVRR